MSYLNSYQKGVIFYQKHKLFYTTVGLLQVGLYILTPYLMSNIVALGILSIEKRGKSSLLFWMSSVFLSICYIVIGSIPKILLVTALWIWGIAFLVSGFIFVIQVKKLLNQIEKGEILCMN